MMIPALLVHGGGEGFWQQFFQRPPLHPMLVNVTAGLIPAAIAFDLLARWRALPSLSSAGWWMTLLAAIVTPFTALAGWLWMGDMPGNGQAMVVHKWLGTIFAALMIGLAIWRGIERKREIKPDAKPGPRPAYLSVAVLFVLALVFQGHLGATMSFGSSQGDEAAHSHTEGGDAHHEATHHDDADAGWKRGISVEHATSHPTTDAPTNADTHDDH